MQFGCCATIDSYDLLEAVGYDYIELSGKAIYAMEKTDFDEVANKIRLGSMPCLGFVAYCPEEIIIAGPGYCLERAKRYAKGAAERGRELGVKAVGIGSPKSRILPDGYDRQTAWWQAYDFFAATAEIFASYNIAACIEPLGNCFCNYINTVEEAYKFVKELDIPNLQLLTDFYNMEQAGEAEMDLTPFIPHIAHVHISDDAGSPQQRSFLNPKKASVHSQRIRRLIESGYTGNLSIEVDIPVRADEAKQSLDIIKKAVEALGKL